jgi:hypothetical protein
MATAAAGLLRRKTCGKQLAQPEKQKDPFSLAPFFYF